MSSDFWYRVVWVQTDMQIGELLLKTIPFLYLNDVEYKEINGIFDLLAAN